MFGVISVLMLGVFLSSADVSLVLATSAEIASGFHKLEMGSWILTSCGLASCVTIPMVRQTALFDRTSCAPTDTTLVWQVE